MWITGKLIQPEAFMFEDSDIFQRQKPPLTIFEAQEGAIATSQPYIISQLCFSLSFFHSLCRTDVTMRTKRLKKFKRKKD